MGDLFRNLNGIVENTKIQAILVHIFVLTLLFILTDHYSPVKYVVCSSSHRIQILNVLLLFWRFSLSLIERGRRNSGRKELRRLKFLGISENDEYMHE